GSLAGSWTAVAGTPAGATDGAPGLVPFLRLHQAMLSASGAVAGCAYLETWHSDLPAFLALHRGAAAGAAKLATAHWVPDLFLQRVVA
ncbi:ribonucleoside-diphosphate reductase subunit alpha, partial [Citrobacter sp. AAK_AS5]